MRYRYNPACSCSRCRVHGFMGPAVLITLGVLFLLDQISHTHWLDFGTTWPALLIVIGLVMFLQHGAPATGHVPREYQAMPPVAPGASYPYQQPPVNPPVATPPAGGQSTPAANWQNPNDPGVHHG